MCVWFFLFKFRGGNEDRTCIAVKLIFYILSVWTNCSKRKIDWKSTNNNNRVTWLTKINIFMGLFKLRVWMAKPTVSFFDHMNWIHFILYMKSIHCRNHQCFILPYQRLFNFRLIGNTYAVFYCDRRLEEPSNFMLSSQIYNKFELNHLFEVERTRHSIWFTAFISRLWLWPHQ